MRKLGLAIIGVCLFISAANAQRQVLDKIVAVVGGNIILKSDVELGYSNYLIQGNQPNSDVKCSILQNLVSQKLLAAQAVIDSIEVKEDEIDNEVDRRMRSMTQRAGGEEKLETFLGRSVIQYKDEIRPDVKELLISERMRAKITDKINTTPQDVERFFKAIAKDSLPTINKEIEVGEVEFDPQLAKEEKDVYRQKAQDLLDRVKKGEDFATLAHLYSQDLQSAAQGGDLGFFDRTTMVKEFTANAFKLKAGEYSTVFESDFGFHFLQVIERRGDQVHARHILITPVTTQQSLDRAKLKADTVYTLLIKNKKLGGDFFSPVAAFYSDNKETKFNGGMILNAENQQVRSTFIPTNRLDPQIALVTDTMKVGGVSQPTIFTDNAGKKSYKIFFLKTVVDAHKANLAQDFPKIKDAAHESKINRTVSEWFEKKRKETFIKIDPEYQSCPTLKGWNTPNAIVQVNP
jgi:peptidyl-prolyl cis-trans isomerase SurA